MTSTFVRRRRIAASVAALAALLTTAGCDGSGSAQEPQTGGSSEAPSSPTPSEEPSTSPSVAPATGLQMQTKGVSVHAPDGWEKYVPPVVVPWQKAAAEPDTYNTTLVVQAHTSLNQSRTLEERAQGIIDQQPEIPGAFLKRAGTVTLDGVEFYHNVGRENRRVWVYQYGAPVGDSDAQINITFDTFAHPDKQDREEIVASILASVEIDESAA